MKATVSAKAALVLDAGSYSAAGPRTRNEDAWMVVEPPPGALEKGWLLALADGVSQSADGQMASQSTVRMLASDYYATPAAWAPAQALDKVLTAHNSWLHAHKGAQGQVPLTTLTALVLRGRRFTLAHVGDCRLYRLRAGQLEQLTEDHSWDQPGLEHVLRRAMGLEQHLVLDFRDGLMEPGDLFVIVSDGVWAALKEPEMHRLLLLDTVAAATAQRLVQTALDHGGNDNATAVVVRVSQVPAEDDWHALQTQAGSLAVPDDLRPGRTLGDLRVLKLLHQSRTSRVWLADDARGQRVVIKTLTSLAASDPQLVQGLLAEGWMLRRAAGRHLPELVDDPVHQQWLVVCTRWHAGQTLAAMATDKGQTPQLSVSEAVRIGLQLARATGSLHRQGILHRDIKPDNIHIDTQGQVRLLDLGVAWCPGISDSTQQTSVPGTPSYLAPELLHQTGACCTIQTDVYALGVSLYHALTGRYPYGEVEAFSHPHFGDPVPPVRHRPDLPQWLESVLLKAVARDPALRFETCEELHLALELGDARPLQVPRASPLVQRVGLAARWKWLALMSLALNLLMLLYLALRR